MQYSPENKKKIVLKKYSNKNDLYQERGQIIREAKRS